MRMLTSALVLAAVPFAVGCSGTSAMKKEPSPSPYRDLIGTWRLVSFENFRDGKRETPYGENPRGYFVYDPTGHVSSTS